MYNLLFVLLLMLSSVKPYAIAPSLQPLHYIDPPALGEFLLDQLRDSFVSSIVPTTFNDAAASIVSAGASGFIAGLAVSVLAVVDGNKNFNDSTIVSAGASGFYFATRSSVDIVGEIIGMSTPVVDVLAVVLPILVSELFKLRARAIGEQQTRVGEGPTMFELMRFDNPSMKELMKFREMEAINGREDRRMPMLAKITPVELVSDITKWITFSAVYPSGTPLPLIASAEAGAIAGCVSQLIRDREDASTSPEARRVPVRLLRLLRSTLEGSFQFLTYQCCKTYLFPS